MKVKKLGLVLEGGASRTFYSCGIMDCLLKENIYADYVIGTSAGIANGVSYVSKQVGRNYVIGTKYLPTRKYLGFHHLLNRKNRSYYNLEFVFNEIPNKLLPFDYDTFADFKGEVIAAVTNIETGKPEYLDVSRNDRKFMILRASCSLPIMFQPIEINGKKYMDGGICDSIPVQQAIESGCDKCLVILTQPRDYRKQFDKSIELSAKAFKKYPEFCKALYSRPENYNNCLEKIVELEKEGRVFVIAPKESLGIKRTEHKAEEIKRIYDLGLEDFEDAKNLLKDFLNK
ncbi:MAG: patatin family protein [Ruminococcus sp.]|nr:patatin family protein [Ruminococcus sp.]